MYLTLNRAGRVAPRSQTFNGTHSILSPLFDDVFEGFFNSARSAGAADAGSSLAARFDVIEKNDRFEARIEIPGVDKNDIDVQIDGAIVRVKAEVKAVEEAVEGERVLHSTRVSRSWFRNFTLPADVAEDRAEASYENGVLTLSLPKKEVVQPKRLAIK